jgi:hypothetical protein
VAVLLRRSRRADADVGPVGDVIPVYAPYVGTADGPPSGPVSDAAPPMATGDPERDPQTSVLAGHTGALGDGPPGAEGPPPVSGSAGDAAGSPTD